MHLKTSWESVHELWWGCQRSFCYKISPVWYRERTSEMFIKILQAAHQNPRLPLSPQHKLDYFHSLPCRPAGPCDWALANGLWTQVTCPTSGPSPGTHPSALSPYSSLLAGMTSRQPWKSHNKDGSTFITLSPWITAQRSPLWQPVHPPAPLNEQQIYVYLFESLNHYTLNWAFSIGVCMTQSVVLKLYQAPETSRKED